MSRETRRSRHECRAGARRKSGDPTPTPTPPPARAQPNQDKPRPGTTSAARARGTTAQLRIGPRPRATRGGRGARAPQGQGCGWRSCRIASGRTAVPHGLFLFHFWFCVALAARLAVARVRVGSAYNKLKLSHVPRYCYSTVTVIDRPSRAGKTHHVPLNPNAPKP